MGSAARYLPADGQRKIVHGTAGSIVTYCCRCQLLLLWLDSHCPHKRRGKPHLRLADGDLTPWKRRDCHETYTTRKVSPAGTTSSNFHLAFIPMAVAINLRTTSRRARNSGTWQQLLASPSLQSASRTQSLRLPSASV